jgi:hypothetical protein
MSPDDPRWLRLVYATVLVPLATNKRKSRSASSRARGRVNATFARCSTCEGETERSLTRSVLLVRVSPLGASRSRSRRGADSAASNTPSCRRSVLEHAMVCKLRTWWRMLPGGGTNGG